MSETLPTLEGNRTLIGDLLISKNATGEMGNLTVEGSITCESINADIIPGQTFSQTITGDGSSRVFLLNHNLGSLSPSVTISDEQGNICIVDITFTSNNIIRIQFPDAIAEGTVYYVSVRK